MDFIIKTWLIFEKCAKVLNYRHGISDYRSSELRKQCGVDHPTLSPEGVSMSEMRSAAIQSAELSEDAVQPIGGVSLPSVSYGL